MADDLEAAELAARWVRHWDEHGFGYWCVRVPGGDRIIGYVGAKRMTVRDQPVLNLVCRLVPDAWGRGLATEAVAGAVSWVMAEMPTEVILARVRPENLASRDSHVLRSALDVVIAAGCVVTPAERTRRPSASPDPAE